jgi:hypothetical protein
MHAAAIGNPSRSMTRLSPPDEEMTVRREPEDCRRAGVVAGISASGAPIVRLGGTTRGRATLGCDTTRGRDLVRRVVRACTARVRSRPRDESATGAACGRGAAGGRGGRTRMRLGAGLVANVRGRAGKTAGGADRAFVG